MLNIFSCASLPYICLIWRNVYLNLLPIFDWVVIFDFQLHELFVDTGE